MEVLFYVHGWKDKDHAYKKEMSAVDLSKILDCTPTNVYNKLKRDNFSEKELKQIADILNCDYDGIFTYRDTGKKIWLAIIGQS